MELCEFKVRPARLSSAFDSGGLRVRPNLFWPILVRVSWSVRQQWGECIGKGSHTKTRSVGAQASNPSYLGN